MTYTVILFYRIKQNLRIIMIWPYFGINNNNNKIVAVLREPRWRCGEMEYGGGGGEAKGEILRSNYYFIINNLIYQSN